MRLWLLAVLVLGGPAIAEEQTSACASVVETLQRLENVLPTIAGKGGAFASTYLPMVATLGDASAREAAAAGWTAEAVAALTAIATETRSLMQGAAPLGPDAEARMLKLAGIVAAAAQGSCRNLAIPLADQQES
ncbi:MAG: hypothetical protein JWR75_863 [Devosia sp.]|nr:hypothetical protein [Devosia sp.]